MVLQYFISSCFHDIISIFLPILPLHYAVSPLIHGGYRLDNRQQPHSIRHPKSHGRQTRPPASRSTPKPTKTRGVTTLWMNNAIKGFNVVHITHQPDQAGPTNHRAPPRGSGRGTGINSNLSATDVSTAFLWLPLLAVAIFSLVMISLVLLTRRVRARDTAYTRRIAGICCFYSKCATW